MPFRHISNDLKQRSLWLLNNGYIPTEASQILGVSQRSLLRWSDNYERYGNVSSPRNPNCGQPRILTPGQVADLLALVKEAPEMFLDEMQDWMALHHDAAVSKTTLDRNIRETLHSPRTISAGSSPK
ncbi:hypothetical protein K439DRAFT_1332429 [Ramaria rubella]|nr:hypothetical protein K439DRAFT_1332429 [Ramaria rubella]